MTLVPPTVLPRLSDSAVVLLTGPRRVPATLLTSFRVAPKVSSVLFVVPPMSMLTLDSRMDLPLNVFVSDDENDRVSFRIRASSSRDRPVVPRVDETRCPSEVMADPVRPTFPLVLLNALFTCLSDELTLPSRLTRLPRLPMMSACALLVDRSSPLFLPATARMSAPSMAEMNAVPTRELTAAVFALATPGVTVPPPLPMQQTTPGPLEELATEPTRSLSKLPGSMTVVQHLLDRMFLMVPLVSMNA